MSGGAPAHDECQPSHARRRYPDDLLLLEDLDDTELVQGLRSRYEELQIYTWVGGVLVSINPYRQIGVFAEELASQYADEARMVHSSSSSFSSARYGGEGVRSGSGPDSGGQAKLPPHLFAVVARALHAPGQQHALLISGESGAGKTEATRAALSFLAQTCGAADTVRDRLLHSNPVLEAFGNASTRQNSNSSRFGKFIQVHFSPTNQLQGASLRPYMLEASRVAGELPAAERTYHIFYQIRAVLGTLAGSLPGMVFPSRPLFERIAGTPGWHEIARHAGHVLVASSRLAGGPSDQTSLDAFEDLYGRMLVAGMTHAQVLHCASVVAAVGLLADGATQAQGKHAGALEALLGISREDLDWFLTRVETTVGAATKRERLVRTRSEHESRTLLSSLAQELYTGLFNWVTRLVAHNLSPASAEEAEVSAAGGPASAGRRLGLLDLYGFEVFASNGFEQFLINYCNERIQQLFNRQVFLSEAEEYAAEGLDSQGCWKQLAAACRLPALSLLEGQPGGFVGIFGVVNDRSRCGFDPSSCGDGGEIAEAITTSCAKHPCFRRPGREVRRVFGIAHFAGEVFYEARHFVHKNSSSYKPDIIAFLRRSGSAFVSGLFEAESDRRLSTGSRDLSHAEASAPGRRRLLGTTIVSAFKAELNELCATLEAHDCHHIRCLRPNDNQAPLRFDTAPMLRQCRYSGLLEATRIRQCGFAHRRAMGSFSERYALVLRASAAGQIPVGPGCRTPEGRPPPADSSAFAPFVEATARAQGFGREALCVGRSKVFLREVALHWLEETRTSLARQRLEAVVVGRRVRRCFVQQRCATVAIQALVRGFLARRKMDSYRAAKAHALTQQIRAAKQEVAALLLQRWWQLLKKRWAKRPAPVPLTPRSQELWKAKRRAAWVNSQRPPQPGDGSSLAATASSASVARAPWGAPSAGTRRRPEHFAPGSSARPPRPRASDAARGCLTPRGLPVPRPGAEVVAQRSHRDKENEAPHSLRSSGRKDSLKGLATSPPASPRVAQSPPRVGSPESLAFAKQRQGLASAMKPCSPERTTERLQVQLLRVGRALRDKELPRDKAALLEGVLETVMGNSRPPVSARATGRTGRGSSSGHISPPWRHPGRTEGWTSQPISPVLTSRKVRAESVRPSRVGMSSPTAGEATSAAPVRSASASRKSGPRDGSWAAPEGFFCIDADSNRDDSRSVPIAEVSSVRSPLGPMASLALDKLSGRQQAKDIGENTASKLGGQGMATRKAPLGVSNMNFANV